MGQNMDSSEIEQRAREWKGAVLHFIFTDDPKNIRTIKGNPAGVLKFFRDFEKNPNYRIISLKKAFELKDIPVKIWGNAKKIRYIPMYLRSKRNEFHQVLKETCYFGPVNKKGDD